MQGSIPREPGWAAGDEHRTRSRSRSRSHVGTARLIVAGYLALVLGGLIALTLTAPYVQAAEAVPLAGDASLTVVAVTGSHAATTLARVDVQITARPAGVAQTSGSRPAVTPPPTDTHLGPSPAHPYRPGWGWVVLGLICFAVVLGLAWPDHRDGG